MSPTAGAPTASPVASPGANTAQVTFAFHIPAGATGAYAARRKPAFVSPSTQGVLVQIYTHPESSNSTPVASYGIDVSPSSSACTPATGSGRTCTFALAIPGGDYDFVDTLYDAPPLSGSFASAKVLGVGRLTQSVTLHATNTIAVSIGGRVASIVLGPKREVAVNGAPDSYALSVSALDADGNTIVAGATDPYDNPITVTTADTGAHTTLSLDGGTPSTSVTTTLSSDVITVAYDGGGSAGYYATFAAAASGTPVVAAGLDSFNATLTLVSFLGIAQTQTETIVEPHNTGQFVVTPAANCANVTTAGPLSGTGSTETFVLASGTKAATCYVTAASETGMASVPIKVVNLVPGQVTIPAHRLFAGIAGSTPAIEAFDVANGGTLVQTISGKATTFLGMGGIARDSSGAIYVTDLANVDVFAPDASGNVAPTASFAVDTSTGTSLLPHAVGLDRAGDIVVSSILSVDGIFVYPPGSTKGSVPSATLSEFRFCSNLEIDGGLAVDPSGQIYSAGPCGIDIFPYGATTPQRTIALGSTNIINDGVAVDLAGDVFVTDSAGTTFSEYGPQANGAATPIRTGTGLADPQGIAVDNDGTVYVVTHPAAGSSTTTAIAVFAPGATTPTSTFPISTSDLTVSLSL